MTEPGRESREPGDRPAARVEYDRAGAAGGALGHDDARPGRGAMPPRTKLLRDNATLIALVVLGVFLAFYNDVFFTPRNLNNIALQVATTGIIAVGMTMVILIGGIDLSVGSIVALAAIGVTWLMQHGISMPLAVILTLAGGVLVGLWNGFWIARYKIPSFIITLGMMTIARGVAHRISQSSSIPVTDKTFPAIGGEYIPPGVSIALLGLLLLFVVYRAATNVMQKRRYALEVNIVATAAQLVLATAGLGLAMYVFGTWQGIPVPVAIFAVVAMIGSFWLRDTRFGRRLYAIGGNAEAARLSGIDIARSSAAVFVIVAALAAIAGIILASRLGGASPNFGTMLELDVITAVVIGGTSLAGGIGTIGGSVIGVFLIGVLANGMSLENVDKNYQDIIKGLIIIAAVWFDVFSKRKKA